MLLVVGYSIVQCGTLDLRVFFVWCLCFYGVLCYGIILCCAFTYLRHVCWLVGRRASEALYVHNDASPFRVMEERKLLEGVKSAYIIRDRAQRRFPAILMIPSFEN